MKFLSDSRVRILDSLSKYKFLTAVQLHKTGVTGSAQQARKTTREFILECPGIIDFVSPGIVPGVGRIPNLYFLTKKGAAFAAEHLSLELTQIKHPVGKIAGSFFDYSHRVATIDCLIAFRRWTESEGHSITFMDAYFDKVGANRSGTERSRAKTKIDFGTQYLIADGACMFAANGRKYLFLLEFYNGMDTKRVIEQLHKHAVAMSDGSPSVKYGYDRGNVVTVVFEKASAKTAAMTRMRTDKAFDAFRRHFLFKSLEAVESDFARGWELFDGERVNLI